MLTKLLKEYKELIGKCYVCHNFIKPYESYSEYAYGNRTVLVHAKCEKNFDDMALRMAATKVGR